jgi:nitroreductase/NAD-dependent dihydropyrimidine dehydrogenase PreA subunit
MKKFQVDKSLCVQCGECVRDCAFGLITMEHGYPVLPVDKEPICIECQHCMTVCKPGAVSILGLDPADSLPLDGSLPDKRQMELLIKGRRSIRFFKPEPLPEKTVYDLLTIAAHAPTGVNVRGVEFIVVVDRETMEGIRQETMEALQELVSRGAVPNNRGILKNMLSLMERGNDPIFRGAPHLLIASAADNVPCREADVCIALSYFELLANSARIGTTWCGLGKWILADLAPHVLHKLGVPENHDVAYLMLFGKPDVKYHRTVQRDQDARIRRLRMVT